MRDAARRERGALFYLRGAGLVAAIVQRLEARGRLVEVNNGRAAMLGIMAVLSESKGLVVPPLDYIDGFPKYSGDIMVPFEGQFHVNEALGAWTEAVLAR